jgi:cell division protein FtsZ
VNEACNLIRTATENEDAQINFGVVADESMGEDVKITVIATGFQRDSLPEIERRNPHFPFTIGSSPHPAGAQTPHQPEPEQATASENGHPEPPVEELPPNDYEMPAILRKQRRLVQ